MQTTKKVTIRYIYPQLRSWFLTACFVLCMYFCFVNKATAQNELLSAKEHRFFTSLYAFNFQDADTALQHIPIGISSLMSKANWHWWLMVSGEKPTENLNNCKKSLNQALKLIEHTTSTSKKHAFYRIYIYAYKARLELFDDNFFAAAKNLHYCTGELKKSLAYTHPLFQFSSGLYYYFVEESLSEYPFLYLYLAFYPRGDKLLGLELLQKASESTDLMLSTEANYFLVRIYLAYEKDYEQALVYTEKLTTQFPNNLLFRYFRVDILKKMGNKPERTKEIEQLEERANKNPQLTPMQKQHWIPLLYGLNNS